MRRDSLERLCTSPYEQAAYRDLLTHRTETLVRRHPTYLPLVRALAAELFIRDELSCDEVAAIIAQLEGEIYRVPAA